MEPEIIADEREYLVINKPAGLITHSDGRTVEPSLAEWIASRYPRMTSIGEPWVSPQGESVPISGLVHRLDRTTSGVMLAAKTPEMFDFLRDAFKGRHIKKEYLGWVYGHIHSEAGTIVAAIERTKEVPRRWIAVPCEVTHTRAAITEWQLLKRGYVGEESVSKVQLSPHTGRTHQLRVHMAHIQHPLVSDHLYASEFAMLEPFKRPALHASSIGFRTPSGNQQHYIAPESSDFLAFESHFTRLE